VVPPVVVAVNHGSLPVQEIVCTLCWQYLLAIEIILQAEAITPYCNTLGYLSLAMSHIRLGCKAGALP